MAKGIIWVHDERFSKQQVVINPEFFPGIKAGDMIEIIPINRPLGIHLEVIRIEDELLQKQSQLQISIAQNIASLFEFQARTEVLVRKVEPSNITADYIELSFRDQYISRADMKRLKSIIVGTSVYIGKKVVTLGIRAQVKDIVINGKSVSSGYISENTKTIFRSESAKFFIFIQMSSEMWEFDEDGDLYLEKCVHGFLAELFTKWKMNGNNHVVSIVLFSRIYYHEENDDCPLHDHDALHSQREYPSIKPNEPLNYVEQISLPKQYRDFYRVVIDWEIKYDWMQVLIPLRDSIIEFRKDILQRDREGSMFLSGEISTASEGNVLEAINLALNPYDKHYIDRDLMRTGLSIIIITPGSGLFEVDKKLCRLTTQRMIDNGIGLDLVSLSKPPLHSVPLFQFQSQDFHLLRNAALDKISSKSSNENEHLFAQNNNFNGQKEARHRMDRIMQTCDVWDPLYFDEYDPDVPFQSFYTIPQWIDVSFWQPEANRTHAGFMVRCKMSEVQQMGIMEQVGQHLVVDPLIMDSFYDTTTAEVSQRTAEDSYKRNTAMIDLDCDRYDELSFTSSKANEISKLYIDRFDGDFFDHKNRVNSSLNFKKIETYGSNLDMPSQLGTWRNNDIRTEQNRNASFSRLDELFTEEKSKQKSKSQLNLEHGKEFRAINIKNDYTTNINTAMAIGSTDQLRIQSPINIQKNISAESYSNKGRGGMELNRKTHQPNSLKEGSPLDYSRSINRQSPSRGLSSTQVSKLNLIRQNYINPCNPSKNFVRHSSQVRRWLHVFPKVLQPENNAVLINWKSLCTPACLPLTTDYFPTSDELRDYYEEYMYMVGPSDEIFPYQDDHAISNKLKVEALLVELVGQRLAQGFQLVVPGNSDINAHNSNHFHEISSKVSSSPKSYEDQRAKVSGKLTLLCLGDHFHKLTCDESTNHVEVRRYVRKISYDSSPIKYKCHIWAKGAPFYQEMSIKFTYPALGNYNWNYLDHLLSGYQDEMTDTLRFWQTRFLLIPLDTPQVSNVAPVINEPLDEEELRVAGFKKFLEVFEKARWIHPNERRGKKIHEASAINVFLTTLYTSSFVREEFLRSNTADIKRNSSRRSSHSFCIDEGLTKSVSTNVILAAMQDSSGVAFKDRRWHFRLYEKTFIGGECVDWMIKSFKDIETRIEAVAFGNELLSKGVFEHVLKKHNFLDGHYFYRVRKDFLIPKDVKEKLSWFKKMRGDNPADLSNYEFDSERTQTVESFELSKKMIIDLDLGKKSTRNEIAFLHYDTVHNPKNCYHFQIHWLVCTARLIEDMLSQWTRLAEKCGMKLIEAPVEQTTMKAEENPFQSVIEILLAIPIPSKEAVRIELEDKSIEIPPLWFEMELMKQFDFILDIEADSFFHSSHVTYSYSKTSYKMTQFIHKSGSVFVQVRDDGTGFNWVVNRLLLTSSANTPVNQRGWQQSINPDSIRIRMVEFCKDRHKLSTFYKNAIEKLKNVTVSSCKLDTASISTIDVNEGIGDNDELQTLGT